MGQSTRPFSLHSPQRSTTPLLPPRPFLFPSTPPAPDTTTTLRLPEHSKHGRNLIPPHPSQHHPPGRARGRPSSSGASAARTALQASKVARTPRSVVVYSTAQCAPPGGHRSAAAAAATGGGRGRRAAAEDVLLLLPSMGRSGKRMQRGGRAFSLSSLEQQPELGVTRGELDLLLAGVEGSRRPAMSSHELMTSASSESACASGGGAGLDLQESGGGGGGGGGGVV